MRGFPKLLIVVVIGITAAGATARGDETPGTSGEATGNVLPPAPAGSPPRQVLPQPCFGAGYLPYAYPGFETCPCGHDGCFHPAPYYCGGKPYGRQWLRKWIRAHLGCGSMLDGYPCPCIFPTVGRTYHHSNPGVVEQRHHETVPPPEDPIPEE